MNKLETVHQYIKFPGYFCGYGLIGNSNQNKLLLLGGWSNADELPMDDIHRYWVQTRKWVKLNVRGSLTPFHIFLKHFQIYNKNIGTIITLAAVILYVIPLYGAQALLYQQS